MNGPPRLPRRPLPGVPPAPTPKPALRGSRQSGCGQRLGHAGWPCAREGAGGVPPQRPQKERPRERTRAVGGPRALTRAARAPASRGGARGCGPGGFLGDSGGPGGTAGSRGLGPVPPARPTSPRPAALPGPAAQRPVPEGCGPGFHPRLWAKGRPPARVLLRAQGRREAPRAAPREEPCTGATAAGPRQVARWSRGPGRAAAGTPTRRAPEGVDGLPDAQRAPEPGGKGPLRADTQFRAGAPPVTGLVATTRPEGDLGPSSASLLSQAAQLPKWTKPFVQDPPFGTLKAL